jgi:hypothetical protein
MYGNVISINGEDGSLTRYDPDHVFPWSRGGLTTNDNLIATHFAANRWAKSNTIVANLDRNNMQRGLTSLQFKNLIEYAENVIPNAGRNTRLRQRQDVFHWLTRTPHNSCTISDFKDPIKGGLGTTTDGKEIYEFLKRLDEGSDVTMTKGLPSSPSNNNNNNNNNSNNNSNTTTPTTTNNTKNHISINMRIETSKTGTKSCQIWGDKSITIAMKDTFKAFKMMWNPNEKYWYKLGINDDDDTLHDFINSVRSKLDEQCVDLIIDEENR